MMAPGFSRLSRYEKILLLIAILTLPLVNPWVRGDGVGYYAYARAPLIQGNFDFEPDWTHANPSFRAGRMDEQGNMNPQQYTSTGHLANYFAVGPAILWTPFLVVADASVLAYDRLGGHAAADGFSLPYTVAMALATAFYGFVGLWLCFRLARKHVAERWAFIATMGIWFASSLPVYLYFNPSWSHAHSAFAVALFLWYWDKTFGERNLQQWVWLGLVSALMVNVYFPNGILLIVPLAESLVRYAAALRNVPRQWSAAGRLFLENWVYLIIFLIGMAPTFWTRKVVYGSPLNFGGYEAGWTWGSPALMKVLFSAQHGLISWTPIVGVALVGLILFLRKNRKLAGYLLLAFISFFYMISSYPAWHGVSSYGNRFFVSLTAIFVVGLAAAFEALEGWLTLRRAQIAAWSMTAALALWNAGFIFQWGTHLIPIREAISWRQMASNQFVVVPKEVVNDVWRYATHRREMMNHIERVDIEQTRSQRASDPQEHE